MIDVVEEEVDVLDEDELHPPLPPPPPAPTWIEGGTELCVGITVRLVSLGGSVGIGCIGIDGMLPNGV